jgi:hypothetical protein
MILTVSGRGLCHLLLHLLVEELPDGYFPILSCDPCNATPRIKRCSVHRVAGSGIVASGEKTPTYQNPSGRRTYGCGTTRFITYLAGPAR